MTEQWNSIPAIVELFGHSIIAGYITEETHVGTEFLRVDVPATESTSAFTKFYHANAVYATTPTDEETMLMAVKQMQTKPVSIYVPTSRQLERPTWADEADDYYDE